MPRYKEYNELRVIEKAMYQFWMHGYGASSVSMLTDRMRINKFSLYDAFESKEALLLRTMEYYFETFFKEALEELRRDKNIIKFISSMLEPHKSKLQGCFILTITAETGSSIPGAVNILSEYIHQLEHTLRIVLQSLHPEATNEKQDIMVRQLLALLTSVPLMHTLKPKQFCTRYAQKILAHLN